MSDDGEDNERREIEWWEAVEMQPYRHLASRLRASRSLYGGGDRVAARMPMPRPGDIYSVSRMSVRWDRRFQERESWVAVAY